MKISGDSKSLDSNLLDKLMTIILTERKVFKSAKNQVTLKCNHHFMIKCSKIFAL